MGKFSRLREGLMSPASALAAAASAVLLVLAFPNFDLWFVAWFALVPLLFAIEREKESVARTFLTGWTFGVVFFFGSCWWLTFAPVTYAGLPSPLVYFFLFCACAVVGVFPGLFGALLGIMLRRFGAFAMLAAPAAWVFAEFLRIGLTGNNWNALGYSQAFRPAVVAPAAIGGVYLVSYLVCLLNSYVTFKVLRFLASRRGEAVGGRGDIAAFCLTFLTLGVLYLSPASGMPAEPPATVDVVAVQPNVPMDGTAFEKFGPLLARHVALAEGALAKRRHPDGPAVVVFPESPMIFQYGKDEELQMVLAGFTTRNRAALIVNSAEFPAGSDRAFNSAVMIDEFGGKAAQYDKIHLLPFGEYIPLPDVIAGQLPAFVGNFRSGEEYDLLPFGATKAGVMICFESHFGSLSREYARRGAGLLVEMTNDGYLGNTPVLRQHLANTVFRAVETGLPVVRATNVGVTALVGPDGEVSDAAPVYAEDARVWTIAAQRGDTIYVRYGDLFAWLMTAVTLGLTAVGLFLRRRES